MKNDHQIPQRRNCSMRKQALNILYCHICIYIKNHTTKYNETENHAQCVEWKRGNHVKDNKVKQLLK